MNDLIVKRPCSGTPEPHDLHKKRSEAPADKSFIQKSEKQIKRLNAHSRRQQTIWIILKMYCTCFIETKKYD